MEGWLAVREDLHPVRRAHLEASNSEMLVVQLRTAPTAFIVESYCKPAPDEGILERTMPALHEIIMRHQTGRLIAVGDFNIPGVRWVQSHHGADKIDGFSDYLSA